MTKFIELTIDFPYSLPYQMGITANFFRGGHVLQIVMPEKIIQRGLPYATAKNRSISAIVKITSIGQGRWYPIFNARHMRILV